MSMTPARCAWWRCTTGHTSNCASWKSDYDPTDKLGAMHRLQWAEAQQEFITGLIYYNPNRQNLAEAENLVDTPLSQLSEAQLRPSKEALEGVDGGFDVGGVVRSA